MSGICHNCGTQIDEDEDTLCGQCKSIPAMTKHMPDRVVEDWGYLLDHIGKGRSDGNLAKHFSSEEISLVRWIETKDTRIAELEAHQEYQMREEGSLRDAIDRLKAELAALAEKMAQLERLRLALERIQKLGTSRTLPGRTFDGIKIPSKSFENEYAKIAREALAATEPRDLTKPRNYGSIEVEGAKSD